MPKLCKRCKGAGTLFRNPRLMTISQYEQSPRRAKGFGRWFTTCTDCGGSGVKGIK